MKLLAFALLLALATLSQTAKYSQPLAARFANISSAVYFIDTYEQVQANECPHCYPQFRVDTVKRGFGFVYLIGVDPSIRAITVAFRGTDNLKNWMLDDFRIFKRKLTEIPSCKKCETHFGFFEAFDTIRNRLGVDISVEVRRYVEDP